MVIPETPQEELDRLKRELKLLEDPATITSFGQMSFEGDGVPQDFVEAASWFRIAAEQGYAQAQHNLALMYENGQGVSQDYAEAAKWYHIAAEQGFASSQNNLGVLFETGNGVAQDHVVAMKWYRAGAAGGDVNAISSLNRLEARSERDKHEHIVCTCTDFMADNLPLIGDCSLLPHPKRTLLYAIKWVMAEYLEKQEVATDRALSEAYDKMLGTLGYVFNRLVDDWQEIDPEDKDAVAKLAGYDSFPDWALSLKCKYINEDKASREALDVASQVLIDRSNAKSARANPSDPDYGSRNKVFTREMAEAALKRLLGKLPR